MFLKLNRTFEAEGTGSSAPLATASGAAVSDPASAASISPAADAKPADPVTASSILYADKAPDASAKDGEAKPAEAAAKEGETAEAAKEGEGDKEKAEADKLAAEVPEDGKYEFKMPDGIELDKELADKAMPVLKEAGVNRAGADKLAAFIAAEKKAEFDKLSENWTKVQEGWQAEAKADKEIGGSNFDASVIAANKALAKFGTDGLREYLTASGGGNHPELIRFVARVGNAISDDKPIGSGTTDLSSKTAAEIMYPNN